MAEMIIIEYREKRLYSFRLGVYVLVFDDHLQGVTNDLFFCWRRRSGMVDLLTGILARAQQRVEEGGFAFDFDLYNYYFMSNHLHLLLGVVELVDKSLLLEWVCRNREASQQVPRLTGHMSSSRTTPSRSSRRSTPWTGCGTSWPGHGRAEVEAPRRRRE
ncbi:MAG: hypothetical protein R3F60_18200 [bacterium]